MAQQQHMHMPAQHVNLSCLNVVSVDALQLHLPFPQPVLDLSLQQDEKAQAANLQRLAHRPDVKSETTHLLAAAAGCMESIVPRMRTLAERTVPANHPTATLLNQHCMPYVRAEVTTLGTTPTQQLTTQDAHLLAYTDPTAPSAEPSTHGMEGPKPVKRRKGAHKAHIQQELEDAAAYTVDTAAAAGELAGFLQHNVLSVMDGEHDAHLQGSVLSQAANHLLTARSLGYLAAVPAATLQGVLRKLQTLMRAGTSEPHKVAAHRGHRQQHDMTAVQAAVAALHVLSTPSLPPEVYMEEVLDSSIHLCLQLLTEQVLPPLDMRWKLHATQQEQEREEHEEPVTKKGKGGRGNKKTSRAAAGSHGAWSSQLLLHLEQALSLLVDVLAVIKVSASSMLPLVRVLLGCLTVAELPTVFKVKAMDLVVAFFRHTPEQRMAVRQELLAPSGLLAYTTLGTTTGVKGPPREYQVQKSPQLYIQLSSALLVQLVQAAAELPAADADADAVAEACKVPMTWCDRFWLALMDLLPTAKAAKSEGSSDLKAFMEHLLADLLAVQHLPEWPAAQLLLRRMALSLNTPKGLQHPDNNVRLVCIELLGSVVASIVKDKKLAEEERPRLDQLLAAMPNNYLNPSVYCGDEEKRQEEVAQRLLQGHLAVAAPSHLRRSARRLLALRMLGPRVEWEKAHAAAPISSSQPDMPPPAHGALQRTGSKSGKKKKDKVQHEAEAMQVDDLTSGPSTSMLVVEYRGISGAAATQLVPNVAYEDEEGAISNTITLGATTGLPDPLPAIISRWLLQNSPMGRGIGNLLLKLLETGTRLKDASSGLASAAGLRCRAIRALSAALEADERLLQLPDVVHAVDCALSDEAVSVREASLELLGKHIVRSSELASAYFAIISRATQDAGVSVRKRAVKVLWDCCVHCPAFPLTVQAMALILQRAGDTEDSVRKLATQLCGGLWFSDAGLTPGVDLDADGAVSTGQVLYAPASSLATNSSRSAAARAKQLAEVCGAVYAEEGNTIHLPLPSDHALVVILQSILMGGPPGQAAELTGAAATARDAARTGACEVAAALLKRTLELGDAAAAAMGAAAGGNQTGGNVLAQALRAGRHATARRLIDGQNNDEEVESAPQAAAKQPAGAPANGHAPPQGTPFAAAAAHEQESSMATSRQGLQGNSLSAAQLESEQLSSLLALHALCAADVRVVVPSGQNPSLFVQALQPLIKLPPGYDKEESREMARISAERLLAACHCIQAVAARGMGGRVLEARLVRELTSDLGTICSRHNFLAVVEGAVQCLCQLAKAYPNLPGTGGPAPVVVQLAGRLYHALQKDLTRAAPISGTHLRFMYLLGQLCRFGADILDSSANKDTLQPSVSQSVNTANNSNSTMPALTPSVSDTAAVSGPCCAQCQRLLLAYYNLKTSGQAPAGNGQKPLPLMRIKESALQALGFLFTSQPIFMSDCRTMLRNVLEPGQPLSLKQRALGILCDVLQAEEDTLKARQHAVKEAASTQAGTSMSVSLTRTSVQQRSAAHGSGMFTPQAGVLAPALADTPASTATAATQSGLAKRNGEGDMSIAGSEVQQVLPMVLALATEVGVDEATAASQPEDVVLQGLNLGVALRRRVMDLLEMVQRAGMTVPWKPVPWLVALACDYLAPATANKALRVLKLCCTQHEDYVAPKLVEGLAVAARFTASLHKVQAHTAPAADDSAQATGQLDLPPEVMNQLCEVWSLVIQPSRNLKQRFLTSLLQQFRDAGIMHTVGPSSSVDPVVMAFNGRLAAALPFRRGDEPLLLMHLINQTVSLRGNNVMDAVKACMTAAATMQQGDGDAAAPAAQQPHTAAGAEQPAASTVSVQQGSAMGGTPSVAHGRGSVVRKGGQQGQAVPQHVAAAKASLAMCVLLVLKKYLREAYKLADERCAAYNPHDVSARAQEEKTPVNKDAQIRLMMEVVDISAATCAPDSKAFRELYKATKFLLDNDAANYKQATEAVLEAAAAGDDAAATAAPKTGGKSTGKGKGRAASRAGASQKKSTGKKRRKTDSDEDEDSEEAAFEEQLSKRKKAGSQKKGAGGGAKKGKRKQAGSDSEDSGEGQGGDDDDDEDAAFWEETMARNEGKKQGKRGTARRRLHAGDGV